jgi:hypothetical protein
VFQWASEICLLPHQLLPNAFANRGLDEAAHEGVANRDHKPAAGAVRHPRTGLLHCRQMVRGSSPLASSHAEIALSSTSPPGDPGRFTTCAGAWPLSRPERLVSPADASVQSR